LFTEAVNDAVIHLYFLARDPVRIPDSLYIYRENDLGRLQSLKVNNGDISQKCDIF